METIILNENEFYYYFRTIGKRRCQYAGLIQHAPSPPLDRPRYNIHSAAFWAALLLNSLTCTAL